MTHARALAAFILAVSCGVADAGLVDAGTYSSDSASGLDWLDLTQTSGLSYSTVMSGAFVAAGWRYATGNEVAALFSIYTGKARDDWRYAPPDMAGDLIRQLGVSYSINNIEGVYQVFSSSLPVEILTGGRFNDGDPNSYVGIAQYFECLSNCSPMPGTSIWSLFNNEVPATDVNPAYGSFLVRQTAAEVPEPSGLALVLVSIAVAGAVTAKRRSRAVMRRSLAR